MRWATVAVVVVVAATMALLIRPPIKDPALAHELISMQRDIDQFSLRFNSAGPVNIGDLSEALKKKIRNADEVDKANADRLVEILATHGWPTEREVGKEAAFAAMNVVGGYAVTDRMLAMFVRRPDPAAARAEVAAQRTPGGQP